MLKAYDEQLRTDAETPGAVSVTRHGPLRFTKVGTTTPYVRRVD